VRYARNCHPDDLWTIYFTSSKQVKVFREEHGEPDVIEVRQVFNDSLQAREWEHDERWLNKGLGKSIPPQFGRVHSDKTKIKMSKSAKLIHSFDPTITQRRVESYKRTVNTDTWKKEKSISVKKSCTLERNKKVAIGVSKSWNNKKEERCDNIRKSLSSPEYKLSQRCSCLICHKETNRVGLIRFHKHV